MFGEKPIVGQTIIRIKSDRIILPKFTHVEAGEEVSATIDPFQRKIILLQEKELLERLEVLHEKMKLAREEKRLSYSEYQDLQRYFWGMLPLHERKITQKLEYQLFNRKPVASCELKQIQKFIKDYPNLKKIFLEVRKSNIPAINAYKKAGFNQISVRKKYYSDGEDALILIKEN